MSNIISNDLNKLGIVGYPTNVLDKTSSIYGSKLTKIINLSSEELITKIYELGNTIKLYGNSNYSDILSIPLKIYNKYINIYISIKHEGLDISILYKDKSFKLNDLNNELLNGIYVYLNNSKENKKYINKQRDNEEVLNELNTL